ncbi:MAG: hypothetical protein IKV86_05960, partial [Clostridia bacterium]|nr:hypothetical protein [Clostridia bacterium]
MKMNKIIALTVAVMTLSTTAFAASTPITHPTYGCIYLEEPHTQADVKARTVDVDLKVTAVT